MEKDTLLKIANEFGTPTYVYDGDKIKSQYNLLKGAFGDKRPVRLFYAMKALNNINILNILKELGSGIDAVSIEEVYLAIRAGFKKSDIIYTPNMVSWQELKEVIDLGVKINVDNLTFLERIGVEYGDKVPVCVRINPHIMAGGNAQISVGHIDSKFGISIHQVKHIERIVKFYNMKIVGLHMHTGSDIINPDVFLQGAELLYDAAENFKDLEFLDFGSGFKVKYKDSDIVTDINVIGEKISNSFDDFCKRTGRDLSLYFEPGKFLVSEAGTFLVSCNVIKQTTSTVFVGVNSGQNHLIRPMFYNAYHDIKNISNPDGENKLYSVVGYICETDTLGYDRLLPEVKIGDVLSISNAGAYCFTMSNQYNARLRPAEVLVLGDKYHLIRKRETLEDIYKNEIRIKEYESL